MGEEKKKTESAFDKYRLFILAIFCFVGIPASILFYSVYRYYISEEEQQVFGLKENTQRMTSDLRRNLTAEEYFCRFFHEYNLAEVSNPNSNAISTIGICKQLKEYYKDDINFLILTGDGEIKYNTLPYNHSSKTWLDAYNFVRYRYSFNGDRNCGDKGDLEAVKKVLGPLAIPNWLDAPQDEGNYSLCWVDSSGKIPPSAIYAFKWGGLFVYVSNELLESNSHFKYITLGYAAENNIIAGIYDYFNIEKSFWHTPAEIDTDEIRKALVESELHGSSYIKTKNYCVCHQYLAKNTRAFALVKRSNTDLGIFIKASLAFLLCCVLFIPIIKYGWNTIVLKIPGNASIRLKLAFLFFFACGIPLLTLGIISKEYNLHKRMALIEEARGLSVENLLGIEQRYSSFLKNICNEYDEFIDKWSVGLKNNGLNKEYSNVLWDKLKEKEVYAFYCIASEAEYLSSQEGYIRYTGSLDNIKIDSENSDLNNNNISNYRNDELKIVNIIVKKVCSDFNGTELDSYILNKLELIAETIIQKSFPEIISSVIETVGIIREWGVGTNTNMTYFKFISLFDPSKTDYIVLVCWRPATIQKRFVKEMLPNANRNEKNFKVIAYERFKQSFVPDIYNSNNELKKFARRAGIKPTEELEYINFQGENYIAVSVLGRQLSQYGFVGLYPVRNIDSIIYEQSSLLWILGLFCLILSAGLAQILTKSFINPLLTLQEGAMAIEERNFKHRLKELSPDEFGEVAGIFNNVMVGLEELEIAKIVQESMFPKPEFSLGRFTVYGKSVTMVDVGGDYLDFFKVDDNHLSVLVGDVAGHGVGAAVIMAMAKACILGGGGELSSPAAILNRLHKMILATKNQKQKKIMTFQYIHLNSETGEGLYGNAGACSPFLVRHKSGTVEELKMAGAALGAFKKAIYKEMPFKFEDEDTLVFYTDGIVECKDERGEMLGYNGLRQLILDCWDENPEKYYQNIYDVYVRYIGTEAEAGDDLTIVILKYNEPKESAYDVTCTEGVPVA